MEITKKRRMLMVGPVAALALAAGVLGPTFAGADGPEQDRAAEDRAVEDRAAEDRTGDGRDDRGKTGGADDDYYERYDKDGNIRPEGPHSGDGEEGGPIVSREELVEIERETDPQQVPGVYVCADRGSEEVTVVFGDYPRDEFALRERSPQDPVISRPDPCAGKDWVVGN